MNTKRESFINSDISVHINDLSKSFINPNGKNARQNITVLKGINFKIPRSRILGIIGRSGAGKSTLLRCINGLETPDAGSIYIQGMELFSLGAGNRQALLRRIGTVFQTPNLLSTRTVFDNIALPLEIMGVSLKQREELCLKMVHLVGLEHKVWSYPNKLSGGQKQRVAIARALVSEPELLLCDEFTSALDYETAMDILQLLKDLNERLGVTIILITHDMKVVRDICDEVCVLKNGQIVEHGDVENIFFNPKNAETKLLLSSFLNKKLPESIHKRIKKTPMEKCDVLLHLIFSKETAYQPFIARTIQKFEIDINIIAGNVDHIRQNTFGFLIVSIPYDKEMVAKIIEYFEDYKVTIEKLGYMNN